MFLAHMKKWIGAYLLALLILMILIDEPNDDYPQWIWWLTIPIVLWKVPPFSVGDWFWGKVTNMLAWILRPFTRWQTTWPRWVQWVFGIVLIVLFEEFVLRPLGYTMYPWRMDLGL